MPEPPPGPGAHAVGESPHEPTDHEELIRFLERDQLVADTSLPVPPAHLGTWVKAALWLLRVFVVVVSFMVIYTFVSQLS